ncbi:MAG: biopolymer transporter ExbD [Myxococcales bacterium]|nr:biopolymer transporter ExbD [Myxococcales bacterium]
MAGSRHKHRTRLVHAAPRKLDGVRSEMNVTPLVDVCLVLLIIFMVVAPMLSRGKEVELPKTKHHTEKKDLGDQPIVSLVHRPGTKPLVYYDRDPMPTLEALRIRVAEELRRKQGQRIFLKGDQKVLFADVYPVLIAIHEAGSPGVELGTNELK